jgi:HAD superfamily hydrolase (TIGR01509 family)
VTAAFLVDVYRTLVFSDFGARQARVARLADVDPDIFRSELMAMAPERNLGLLSLEEALTRALAACGGPPRDELFTEYRRFYGEYAQLFPDAMPFLEATRRLGVPVALVSNCASETRPMLDALGVLDLVDAAILSCEIGYAKPSAEIYQAALAQLGVQASEAVFVDDKLTGCHGAMAVGLTAVRIARGEAAAADPRDDVPVIRSLLELVER